MSHNNNRTNENFKKNGEKSDFEKKQRLVSGKLPYLYKIKSILLKHSRLFIVNLAAVMMVIAGLTILLSYHVIIMNFLPASLRTFAFDPPEPSRERPIDNNQLAMLLSSQPRLKEVAAILKQMIEDSGFRESGYLSAPNGFALITQVEQIDRNGFPLEEPWRWASTIKPQYNGRVLIAMTEALLFAPRGYYRAFVFVVTDKIFISDPQRRVDEKLVNEWFSSGAGILPSSVGNKYFTVDHNITMLVYEFERLDALDNPSIQVPGRFTIEQHVRQIVQESEVGALILR